MQNPRLEISSIIHTLTSTSSAQTLNQTIMRYFTPDAWFLHPLCQATSRDKIIGVYEWYRIMSPQTRGEVLSVVYDPDIDVLVVEVIQYFHIRFNPFKAAPARLNIRLTLRENDGLHYIVQQEDFYHPTDIAALTLPPLIPLVTFLLGLGTLFSNINAWVFRAVGFTGGGLEDGKNGGKGDNGDVSIENCVQVLMETIVETGAHPGLGPGLAETKLNREAHHGEKNTNSDIPLEDTNYRQMGEAGSPLESR
ncbi:hypothetical protein BJ138DRAFT_1142854 [Hygrophoropsis aurantiaca]|uniref:Uncharacterized protein n=1 Tax=Hygrophoropsis aurantiaca TaxID=72124 RepID=A0ACB8AQ73_9AGAM|nr:hypothetical protein BJ138DRAFT_1142854 [Hygrophoropsis aurantiaca]